MKRIFLSAIVLVAGVAMAQDQAAPQATQAPPAPEKRTVTATIQQTAPTYSDLYCAGFMTHEAVNKTNVIAGGMYSPEQTQYARGNTVFLSGGGFQEGAQYSILREMHDINHYEPFAGARVAVNEAGQLYSELGRLRVTALRGNVAVAEIEFSCQNITINDIVVPFKEHVPVEFRKASSMERYPAAPGRLNARIVMAKEFDTELRPGHKLYLNVGANKGVKVGQYFRAVRYYDPARLNPIDNLSYKAPVGEDTQMVPGKVTPETAKNLPPRNIGEMIVLNVTPTAATAMITNELEDVKVGDWVELEDEQ